MAGIIFAIGDLLIPQENVLFDAIKKPDEFASLVTSKSYKVWAFRGFIGVLMEMAGTVGLYLYLQKSNAERLAFAGLLFTLTHQIVGFGVFAVAYFLYPALGELYLNGNQSVIKYASLDGTTLGIYFMSSFIVTLIGLSLMALAIQKSKLLPKYSGWIVFIGFALIPLPGVALQFIANCLWGVSYLWMAIYILKLQGNSIPTSISANKIVHN